ncbi:hypothetical protein [Limnovirga soli]|uniref:Uncharacterized protein n=1 Tax=Limnovirga soli TaxID=2656915 RepID=A0A8J8FFW9_9BACT|nr:hypothetical protein [Limnovirga soli]NNV57386.1 hypothetical protein [Limnovirga soli]
MKKLFAIALLLSFTLAFSLTATTSHAQLIKTVTLSKSSLSSTDTAYVVVSPDASYVSLELKAVKTSGTPAGKGYVYGIFPDGTNSTKLDSLTVTNVATDQTLLFAIPARINYKAYKIQFVSSGGVWVPTLYSLRRS